MNTSIFTVDVHVTYRRYLSWYLTLLDASYRVVGEAGSCMDALTAVVSLTPDIVFIDIDLPDGNGLSATRQIRLTSPCTAVIVLGNYAAADYRQAAFDAGAVAYIDKLEVVEALPAALAAVTRWLELVRLPDFGDQRLA